jgi:hypothetical protein
MGKGSRRPADKRPPVRLGRGGIGPPSGGAVPPISYKGKGTKGGCEMWVPVAVALLPYALVRMAWASWREKRNA